MKCDIYPGPAKSVKCCLITPEGTLLSSLPLVVQALYRNITVWKTINLEKGTHLNGLDVDKALLAIAEKHYYIAGIDLSLVEK